MATVANRPNGSNIVICCPELRETMGYELKEILFSMSDPKGIKLSTGKGENFD